MNRQAPTCIVPRNLLYEIRARLLWELSSPSDNLRSK